MNELIYLRVAVKITYANKPTKEDRVDAIREAKRCVTSSSTLGMISVQPKLATLIKK